MSSVRSVALAMVAAVVLAACADEVVAPVDGGADTAIDSTTDTATGDASDAASDTPRVPPSDDSSSPATSDGATDGSADSSTEGSAPDTEQSSGQQPDGFTTIRAQITDADGEVCEVCLWLADDATERSRGLMGVTDLGDAVGMVFRFEEATSGSFYMFQTPTPLSIAWFAPDGALVGSADMEPCTDTQAGECPLYSPGASYDLAIEVFDGGLDALGIGPGSHVELIEGSEAERCPVAS